MAACVYTQLTAPHGQCGNKYEPIVHCLTVQLKTLVDALVWLHSICLSMVN